MITELHHPDTDEIIVGRRLQKGDILQRGDVFASSINGIGWTRCHPKFFGRVIQSDCGQWARPTAIKASNEISQKPQVSATSAAAA